MKLISFILLLIHAVASAQNICPICLSQIMVEDSIVLCCGHEFCQDCIKRSSDYKGQCPVCKKQIKYHRVEFNNEPHDLCKVHYLISGHDISNLAGTTGIAELEEILENEDLSVNAISELFIGFDLLTSYVPPTNDYEERQINRVRRRFQNLMSQPQPQSQSQHCLGSTVSCILCSFTLLVLVLLVLDLN